MIPLKEYIIQWFWVIFGERKIVEELIKDFIRTCIEFETKHERFKTFLNLAGIHVSDGKIFPIADTKKDYMRELEFESTDALVMYLRLMVCVRYTSSPFLPAIDSENREEKGCVVNYYEVKSIWTTIINETTYEHGLTEDSFKDLDSICDQFLEDSSVKNPYKIPAIVLSKTNFKDSRKESDNEVRKSKKNISIKSVEEKQINLDIFARVCINEYVEKKILLMERLLAILKLQQSKNYTEITYNDFKDAIKSTWNEKSKNASDSLLFSQNKIDLAYYHIIKEIRLPVFDEEDVIIKLIPFLNGSLETRAFSIRYRCKHQVKQLLDRDVIDASGPEKEQDSKSMIPNSSLPKKPPKINMMMTKSLIRQQKDTSTKASIVLPKSIIPMLKEFKDSASSEVLFEEISKR